MSKGLLLLNGVAIGTVTKLELTYQLPDLWPKPLRTRFQDFAVIGDLTTFVPDGGTDDLRMGHADTPDSA